MIVTFVSECEKKALNRTRRVLDAFANRIGSRSWQTVITQEGLKAVKKLLRKTATKNTAVSCHWIRSRRRSELLWVVGNKSKFNAQGYVPVNLTDKDTEQFMDRNQFKLLPAIQAAASISALFHDFGKATNLFQKKLNPDPDKKPENFEPYRHEWISYRLFQAFVGDSKEDIQWLQNLAEIDRNNYPVCYKDGIDDSTDVPKLTDLPPFARLVAWLILTHHKLPVYPAWKESENSPPLLTELEKIQNIDPLWNSHQCNDPGQKARKEKNWEFFDLPIKSSQWRSKACRLSSSALVQLKPWLENQTNWIEEQLFTTHISRLCLTLADHYYSSLSLEQAFKKGAEEWRNPHYKVYANTEWSDKEHKKIFRQQLDEHLTGVAKYAADIAKRLPGLNRTLNFLEPNKNLTENVGFDERDKEKKKELEKKFNWQDKARKLTEKIGKDTLLQNGFFGINMASTGKGKTRANAKIMTAIGLQTGRVRFSVALGLRVLTLQTGKEFRDKLGLTDEELAIVVGGIAAKQLFENKNPQSKKSGKEKLTAEEHGSASSDEIMDSDISIHYSGKQPSHSLVKWTKKQKGLDELIDAPVLTCTIDHLIPATEGTKGGRQIPAMLRLLTSDLVLDEPDDFGLSDMPALCRLVNWAGMLGSRVLLSTATIPPALSFALFQAYREGWKQYAKANLANSSDNIICAWFDEKRRENKLCKSFEGFQEAHQKFIKKRTEYLQKLPPKRKAEIIEVEQKDNESIAQAMANTIQKAARKLHQAHGLKQGDKTLSVGLVRMANINPLVAVAKILLEKEVSGTDTHIHYCIYHSRYPLAIRTFIENKLDKVLNRKDPDAIWEQPEIKQAIKSKPQVKHHIFIILASPVAEVGRDHDYDWAIVEPSSMRSVIQLAGRILRHRDQAPNGENLILLQKNYKALNKEEICFTRPGFESSKLKLDSHDLFDNLDEKQYKNITAIHRIQLPEGFRQTGQKYINLVELEHKALKEQLFSGNHPAKVWWKNNVHWCGEVQRQQRFRDSNKDEAYYLWLDRPNSDIYWKWKNERVSPAEFGDQDTIKPETSFEQVASDNSFWFDLSATNVYQQLAEDMELELSRVSRRYGEVRLTEYENGTEEYYYHPQLGVYQYIGENE